MKPTVLILNGPPTSGKDTFVDIMETQLGYTVQRHSTVDYVKELACQMGWNGEKTPEMRNMLSDLKDLYSKYFNGPFIEIVSRLQRVTAFNDDPEEDTVEYVTIMIREPDEIQKVVDYCKEFGYPVYTLCIQRPVEQEEGINNTGDNAVFDYMYDMHVHNDGNMDQFYKIVNLAIKEIEGVLRRENMYPAHTIRANG